MPGSKWLNEVERTALQRWAADSDCMLLAILPDGTVIWANTAFVDFIGYSFYEMCNVHNPARVSWKSFSVPDQAHIAFESMAIDTAAGGMSDYDIVKYLRPQTKAPVLCKVNVLRYPVTGDFEVLLVTVFELQDGAHMAMQEMMARHDALVSSIEALRLAFEKTSEKITGMTVSDLEGIAGGAARIALRYPKKAAAIALFFTILILGEPALKTIKAVAALIGFGGHQ